MITRPPGFRGFLGGPSLVLGTAEFKLYVIKFLVIAYQQKKGSDLTHCGEPVNSKRLHKSVAWGQSPQEILRTAKRSLVNGLQRRRQARKRPQRPSVSNLLRTLRRPTRRRRERKVQPGADPIMGTHGFLFRSRIGVAHCRLNPIAVAESNRITSLSDLMRIAKSHKVPDSAITKISGVYGRCRLVTCKEDDHRREEEP